MKRTKLFWFITAFIMVFNFIAYFATNGKALIYISDSLPVLCSIVAIYGVYNAYRSFKSFDFIKTAWLSILIGLVLYFFAESIYGILEIICKTDMNETFPSLADYFWCSGNIAFFLGLVLMYIGYKKSGFPIGNLKTFIFGSLLFIALSFIIIFFLLIPIIKDEETGIFSKIFYLYYPISDILIVSMSIILLYFISQFGKGLISMTWFLLALGFFCFSVSDLLYSYFSWQDTYGNGNFIDMGWNLGYLLMGLSGLYQRDVIKSI
jgi:hypothetical protein